MRLNAFVILHQFPHFQIRYLHSDLFSWVHVVRAKTSTRDAFTSKVRFTVGSTIVVKQARITIGGGLNLNFNWI